MTSIPLPWVITIFAVALLMAIISQSRLPNGSRVFFCVALATVAAVSAFVGLRLEYGYGSLIAIQPHLAVLIPPGFWLGYRSMMVPGGWPGRKEVIGNGIIVALAQIVIISPVHWSADAGVVVITGYYLLRIVSLFRSNPDVYVTLPPNGFRLLFISQVACTAFLTISLVTDAAILLTTVFTSDFLILHLLSGATGLMVVVVLIAILIAIPLFLRRMSDIAERTAPRTSPDENDMEVFSQVDSLMAESELFRDQNLTLARLARRSGLPARAVSAAINRCTGNNFSRYVNEFRIRYSGFQLANSDLPITEIMLDAGFVSKSTFNTEFRRITGKTPSEYRNDMSKM
ncbi:MAG: AraC family transcriptional regulator [Alphaproteobacteria bacterium]